MNQSEITEEVIAKVSKLNELAAKRGQKLSQMALAWTLRGGKVTSALIGASKVSQIEDAAAAVNNLTFTDEELAQIDQILA
ncbi:L-glyceraldehyde 3-phosphate reductase [compost metagenome]